MFRLKKRDVGAELLDTQTRRLHTVCSTYESTTRPYFLVYHLDIGEIDFFLVPHHVHFSFIESSFIFGKSSSAVSEMT